MKNLILFFSCLFISVATFANGEPPKKGTITGKIIDKVTSEALPYVNIIVKGKDGKILTGDITDDNGQFTVKNIVYGDLIVEFQFIGYRTSTHNISLNKNKHDFGTIRLEEDTAQLEEVEIVAETSETIQKVDRKVINVGKDLTSVGATASDVLNNIPSVAVDQQTGSLSLRGNDNVRVLLDGKPTTLSVEQLLQQIPSTSIKSVELITNPSAKYNPEGMSGIINIVLHKNSMMGFNGNVNAGYTYGKGNRFNGSLDLNYKVNKVNFFLNYGANKGLSKNGGYVNRAGEDPIDQDFTFNSDNASHLIKAGLDYYINEKNTLSFYTTQNFIDGTTDGHTALRYLNAPEFNTFQLNDINSDNYSQIYNLNYTVDFNEKGHNLDFEANYSRSDNTEYAVYDELNFPTNGTLNFINDIDKKGENLIVNLDYTLPLSESSKLELGVESRTQKSDDNNITTQLSESGEPLDDKFFKYNRYINSAYFNYNVAFSEKLMAQVGARFEKYDVEAELNNEKIYEDDYFTVYPSAFFTFNQSDKNQFQLSYSYRVDRPSLGQVNPIREFSTPIIISVGNPELDPQFTNSVELNYTRRLKKGSITAGVFYRLITDNISRTVVKDAVDPTKLILSYNNIGDNNAYGFEFSGYYRLAKWWTLNGSVNLYQNTEKGVVALQNAEVDNLAFESRLSNSFKASKRLRFQLTGFYRGANKSLQFNTKPMYGVNTGARYTVLDGKGTISANFNDIFNTMRFAFEPGKLSPYPQTGEFRWPSHTAYIGFSYRFGGGKNKARQRKYRDNNETRGSGGMF
ncbi:outer membrane beta-barrel family protein [Aureivirga sp. CE67]|uniref:outer membrane beta-barrel family protein n=1 Tax=Aureivirga sp. CE67 TaxID=1788983 RepID=UPI0018CB7867|nr:outer membrane beta-barrel family protein [Aureivirga sp. CE67]